MKAYSLHSRMKQTPSLSDAKWRRWKLQNENFAAHHYAPNEKCNFVIFLLRLQSRLVKKFVSHFFIIYTPMERKFQDEENETIPIL